MGIIKNIDDNIANVDWQTVTEQMNEKGYALVSRFLDDQSCEKLISNYNNSIYIARPSQWKDIVLD